MFNNLQQIDGFCANIYDLHADGKFTIVHYLVCNNDSNKGDCHMCLCHFLLVHVVKNSSGGKEEDYLFLVHILIVYVQKIYNVMPYILAKKYLYQIHLYLIQQIILINIYSSSFGL